jgi:hydrogenase-4 component E
VIAMNAVVPAGLAGFVITSLWMLGSARLRSCVAAIALQGAIVGLLPLTLGADLPLWRLVLQATLALALKGAVFPWLILRAIRSTRAHGETDPAVGYSASLLVGVVLIAVSLWISSRLPGYRGGGPSLLVPASLFTAFSGLFLVVARRSAILQVLGYLALENGITVLGMALAEREPLLVEMGSLLDAFAAVFVMGITVFRIGRELDHADADRLADLKDWQP